MKRQTPPLVSLVLARARWNVNIHTMEEVLALKLDADWVVLSACNTASADGRGSEAVSGLGRAFFYAGARSSGRTQVEELQDGQNLRLVG